MRVLGLLHRSYRRQRCDGAAGRGRRPRQLPTQRLPSNLPWGQLRALVSKEALLLQQLVVEGKDEALGAGHVVL